MSTRFTSFAIAGPGDSSNGVITSLLQYRKSYDTLITVKILTRSTTARKSRQDEWEALGATVHPVLDSKNSELKETLRGVDIVVSTIGIITPFDQVPLANAAREAKVALFVPFEFGADASGYQGMGVYQKKLAFREWLESKEGGWKGRWIGYHTGWYTEPVIGDFVGFNVLEKGKPPKVKIWGDGDTQFSTTSLTSLGEFLSRVLSHQPRYSLLALAAKSTTGENRLRIESARTSFNALLKLVEKYYGGATPIEVERVSSAELTGLAIASPDDFVLDMLKVYDQGHGVVGPREGGNWKEWVENWHWAPRSLEEIVVEKLEKAGRLKK